MRVAPSQVSGHHVDTEIEHLEGGNERAPRSSAVTKLLPSLGRTLTNERKLSVPCPATAHQQYPPASREVELAPERP